MLKYAPIFAGKRLLRSEIPLPSHILAELEQKQLIRREAGLVTEKGRLTCRRCNNRDPFLIGSHLCAKCGERCHYCRHCLTLGKVSQCEPLFSWQGLIPQLPEVAESLSWSGALSAGQQRAAIAVKEAIRQQKQLLIWAVTGAGKTEILFPGLEQAFSEGKRVLLATPRADVVKELEPRLRRSFPRIAISALYGGSRDRHRYSQLVIATTHQILRFYRTFDVVIVDEVDAFPYSYDQSLAYAVSQAEKKQAARIYLSATPSQALRSEPLEVIKIPRRFHGFPLPEPRFSWCGNWQKHLKKGKLPAVLLRWLTEHLNQRKPILLFVPTVSFLHQATRLLQNDSYDAVSVHANDSGRHQRIEAFRQQKTAILVTTTILERGVTFPGVQVAVLGADHRIFTETALVQIAGRVGRSAAQPDGDVIFFHYGISQAMRAAKRHIQLMNQEASTK
ncbi:DEAD/DEAH box helicase [Alkalihalobacillus oceani]|uniref:DEAD/DEAH box helicase n=1 Tax=Halalkalibacter oceani TaxID=1653776 RepID=A0A9X2DTI9_9BACI|nr:DEAD/DEAH box helicase [Halalkalibacter oceani]MCM3716133.1 DEAD/DEAH box helicase [Halalkalibacter oceani]